jgi:hypothetical protein
MLRYYLRLLVFGLILFVLHIVAVLYLKATAAENAYLAGYHLKHRLLEETPSPRIILVGGSATTFGVSSPQLEQALGLPAINMGMHGGLGLRYMLDDVEQEIRPHDIVVLSPEYSGFINTIDGNETLLYHCLVNPDGVEHLRSVGQLLALYDATSDLLFSRLKSVIGASLLQRPEKQEPHWKRLYRGIVFDRYGDTSNQDSTCIVTALRDTFSIAPASFDPRAIECIHAFLQRVSGRATIILCYPSIPSSLHARNAQALEQLHRLINGPGVWPAPLPPEAWVLDEKDFLDTVYHLNRRGRTARTVLLIRELRKILQDRGGSR